MGLSGHVVSWSRGLVVMWTVDRRPSTNSPQPRVKDFINDINQKIN